MLIINILELYFCKSLGGKYVQYLCDSFMFENGERYCLFVNKDTGEPLYYPNLYITTQVRIRSESISTMKVIAGSISLLVIDSL